MAKKTQVMLVDDVDGTPAAKSIIFGFNGVEYTIDLNDSHVQEINADFDKWIKAARRSGGRQRRGTGNPNPQYALMRERAVAIRAWAKAQGEELPVRGRIPQRIVDAYDNANN